MADAEGGESSEYESFEDEILEGVPSPEDHVGVVQSFSAHGTEAKAAEGQAKDAGVPDKEELKSAEEEKDV